MSFTCCKNQVTQEYYYESGDLMSRLIFPDRKDTLNYYQEKYYPSGELLSKSTIKEGRLGGDYSSYYVTGNLFERGSFLNGNIDGIFQQYDSLGRLATESYFINGTRILYSVGLHANDIRFKKQLFNIVVNDSIYPIGALVWKNDSIQLNLSHYAVLIGEDTLSNLVYTLKLQIITEKEPKTKFEITFGKPNTNLGFEKIDTIFVTSDPMTILNNIRLFNGHNNIFGRIYVFNLDSTALYRDTTALFFVYKDVFVKAMK
jgi:hypothetical protein